MLTSRSLSFGLGEELRSAPPTQSCDLGLTCTSDFVLLHQELCSLRGRAASPLPRTENKVLLGEGRRPKDKLNHTKQQLTAHKVQLFHQDHACFTRYLKKTVVGGGGRGNPKGLFPLPQQLCFLYNPGLKQTCFGWGRGPFPFPPKHVVSSTGLYVSSKRLLTFPGGRRRTLFLLPPRKCKIKRLETYKILYLKKDFIFDMLVFISVNAGVSGLGKERGTF